VDDVATHRLATIARLAGHSLAEGGARSRFPGLRRGGTGKPDVALMTWRLPDPTRLIEERKILTLANEDVQPLRRIDDQE
jgi:hypothetical protein